MPATTNISEKIKEIESLIEFHQGNANFYNDVKLKAQKAATTHESTVRSLKKSLAKLKSASAKISNAEKASAEVDNLFFTNDPSEDTSLTGTSDDEEAISRVAYDYSQDE